MRAPGEKPKSGEPRLSTHANPVDAMRGDGKTGILKAGQWPHVTQMPQWAAEVRRFRDDATDRSAPSKRQQIETALLYRRALRAMPDSVDGQPPLAVPQTRLLLLDELVTGWPLLACVDRATSEQIRPRRSGWSNLLARVGERSAWRDTRAYRRVLRASASSRRSGIATKPACPSPPRDGRSPYRR